MLPDVTRLHRSLGKDRICQSIAFGQVQCIILPEISFSFRVGVKIFKVAGSQCASICYKPGVQGTQAPWSSEVNGAISSYLKLSEGLNLLIAPEALR